MWTTCPDCEKPFYAEETWQRECIACWKDSKGIDLTKGDQAFRRAQARLVELESEIASLEQSRDAHEASAAKRMRALRTLKKRLDAARAAPPVALTTQQITNLLALCHPDKHGGSKRANEVTRWLLSQRRKS